MFPYYTFPTSPDSEYLRALADERAAREQYAAARRAQEEARARAVRAQAARRAYASPYGSYLAGDYLTAPYNDFDVEGDPLDDALGPYGLGPSPRARSPTYEDPYAFGYRSSANAQRALMEERRRRELFELEREKERRRLEEERIRKILREEREREEAARQRLLEEERVRKATEEERLRQALREEEEAKERERAQQMSVGPIDILRALGLAPPASVSEKVRDSRPFNASKPTLIVLQERFGRQPNTHTLPSGVYRTNSSPIRPFPFGQTSQHAQSPARKIPSPQPTATPISSSRPTPTPPTPEQLAAAEHILAAYRAYVSRKAALATISLIRKRFLAARSGFTLPLTLDYDVASHGRVPPTTVALDPSVSVAELAGNKDDVLDGAPTLAYSPTNASLHAYEEELNRILGSLDAVESNGDMGVRAARRELARAVEREAEKVERWRGVVWRWWIESEKAASAPACAPSPSPVVAPVVMETETPAVAPTSEGEGESIATELLPSAAAPGVTDKTCPPVDAPQGAIPVEAPMEIDIEAMLASDSPPTPVPVSSTSPDDPIAPSATIPITSLTLLKPVEIVETPPVAEVGTETVYTSDSSLESEAPAVDIISPKSTSDDRPATPALSQGPSEPEEMEVESLEVHTPPPNAHVPLIEEPLPEVMRLERKQPVLNTVEVPREEAV